MSRQPPAGPHREFAGRFETAVAAAGVRASNAALAGLCGVSPSAIQIWRAGDGLPGLPTACRVAQALDVCVEWLLTGRGPRQPLPPSDLELLAGLSPRQRAALRILLRGQ